MEDLRVDNGPIGLAVTRSGLADAPPVLFLHGITSCRDSWFESVERLGDRHDCWTLDFRGHGESDRAPGEYLIDHYASDASAVLAAIGRPTVVVGHSLGGVTAAHLVHSSHPLVTAIFLEDPPLFLPNPSDVGADFPAVFSVLHSRLVQMQADRASYNTYLNMARTSPSPMGGVASDHQSERQIRSRAYQLQTFDPSCLGPAIDGRVFAEFDSSHPIPCPVIVLAANPKFGAAFRDGDRERLAAHSPHAIVVAFPEVGHSIRGATVSSARFLRELDTFVASAR